MSVARKPVDAFAFGLMLLLCMSWGFQQVTIKLAASGVSLVMQAGIRSIVATLLLLAWAHVRRIPLFGRDGTLASGVIAGALFAAEFAFVYGGLAYTTASRMIVIFYVAPCFTVLGLTLFAPGEHMSGRHWLGVILAFAGVAVAFAEGFLVPSGDTLIGDLCALMAAILWAATTVVIRATRLARSSATKVLFYQLAVSALAMPLLSLAMGEPGIVSLTPLVVSILVYQSAIVAFASYLVWFWLLTRYLATRLSVFSFLTPLFGVVFGVLILGETLTPTFTVASLLVGAGIVLVNLPERRRAVARNDG